MATATPRIVEIEKTITEEIQDGVTLELTDAEAKALVAVYARIGGSPDKSPRGDMESIGNALRGAGYHWSNGNRAYELLEGSVRFSDDPLLVDDSDALDFD